MINVSACRGVQTGACSGPLVKPAGVKLSLTWEKRRLNTFSALESSFNLHNKKFGMLTCHPRPSGGVEMGLKWKKLSHGRPGEVTKFQRSYGVTGMKTVNDNMKAYCVP